MPAKPSKPVERRGLPLVSRPELAQALGVHADRVSHWEAHDGLPVEIRLGPGRPSKYDLAKVFAWQLARELARVRGGADGTGSLDLDHERAGLANVQKRRAELAVQRLTGEVAPVAEMAAVVVELFGAVKAGMLALPSALAEELVAVAVAGGARAVERRLRDAVTGALKELSSWRPPVAAKGGSDGD
jgi:phage terminase Nu1 subunit (DNA packaging protein)